MAGKFEKVMAKGRAAAARLAKRTHSKEGKVLLLMFAIGCEPHEATDGRKKLGLHDGDGKRGGLHRGFQGAWPSMPKLKF